MLAARRSVRDLLQRKLEAVAEKLESIRLKKTPELIREGMPETLAYYRFPREHWRRIRTNSPLERVMKETRRRTRVVGAFPDGHSVLMLAAARLRHIQGARWGARRYLDMTRLREAELSASQQLADVR